MRCIGILLKCIILVLYQVRIPITAMCTCFALGIVILTHNGTGQIGYTIAIVCLAVFALLHVTFLEWLPFVLLRLPPKYHLVGPMCWNVLVPSIALCICNWLLVTSYHRSILLLPV